MKVFEYSKTERKRMADEERRNRVLQEETVYDKEVIAEMMRNIKEIGDFIDSEISDIDYHSTSNMERNAKKRSVCEVLRRIYQITDSQEIKNLTIEGTLMAKKMTKKLVEYRKEMATKKDEDNV